MSPSVRFTKNEGKNTLEAIYVFPASTNAAVYGMDMKIGDRMITAQIRERNQARQEYEQAKTEGKRASLLEQQRPNVFQMNVANITPGDEIEVTLRYTELLVPTDGIYEFVYPTVVGPRYSTETQETASTHDQFLSSPYTKAGDDPLYAFDIKVRVAAGLPIQNIGSTSHKVNVQHDNLNSVRVMLDPKENNGGNRDFILNYQLTGKEIESGLLLYEHQDENFFLLMVQPPECVDAKKTPPREIHLHR